MRDTALHFHGDISSGNSVPGKAGFFFRSIPADLIVSFFSMKKDHPGIPERS